MAKLTDEKIQEAFAPHLNEGETLRFWAYGVKQPNLLLIIVLIALAILPGVIAVALLTKYYLVGLTEGRFIVLQIKGTNADDVKAVMEYDLASLTDDKVKTSTGGLFTHIRIKDDIQPFQAKFHRAFSKNNRPHSMAIAEAIAA